MSIETSLRLTGMLLIVAAMVAVAVNSEESGAQEQDRWNRRTAGIGCVLVMHTIGRSSARPGAMAKAE